jgi:hypothetical protein
MQFRLTFDDKIFEAFIKKVRGRANGGSLNKALKTMIIEWSAIEDARNTPETGQDAGIIQKNQSNEEDDLSVALDDLEAAW